MVSRLLRYAQQSRAIVLNRFGLALIGRIAPDRSDAEYVRRTRSTKRLRTIVLLCRTGNFANDFCHESYADGGNIMGVAATEGCAGKLLSSVPHPYRVPTLFVLREGKMFHCVIGKRRNGSAESKTRTLNETSPLV